MSAPPVSNLPIVSRLRVESDRTTWKCVKREYLDVSSQSHRTHYSRQNKVMSARLDKQSLARHISVQGSKRCSSLTMLGCKGEEHDKHTYLNVRCWISSRRAMEQVSAPWTGCRNSRYWSVDALCWMSRCLRMILWKTEILPGPQFLWIVISKRENYWWRSSHHFLPQFWCEKTTHRRHQMRFVPRVSGSNFIMSEKSVMATMGPSDPPTCMVQKRSLFGKQGRFSEAKQLLMDWLQRVQTKR